MYVCINKFCQKVDILTFIMLIFFFEFANMTSNSYSDLKNFEI